MANQTLTSLKLPGLNDTYVNPIPAAVFDEDGIYYAGNYCTYLGQIYRCLENTGPGTFDGEAWLAVDVANDINSRMGNLASNFLAKYDINEISVSSGAVTNVASINLTSGIWLIILGGNWASNTSGYRRLAFNTSTSSSHMDRGSVVNYAPTNASSNNHQLVVLKNLAAGTYYFNVYQNSGSTLNFDGYYNAIKLR